MAKWSDNSVLDAPLDKIATGTQITVNPGQPTTRANALSTALAVVTVDSGDFSKSTVGTSRRLTVAAQDLVPITASGTASHVSVIDGSSLLHVTTTTEKELTTGDAVSIQTWNVTMPQPV